MKGCNVREEFEKWYKEKYNVTPKRVDDVKTGYSSIIVFIAWEAYQAGYDQGVGDGKGM